MRFQLLAAFALLFVLALSAPSAPLCQSSPDSFPVCSASEGALIEDCREALTKIDTTWPRVCTLNIVKNYVAATVRTCRITTWDPASAHCLEGSKVICAAQKIMSTCRGDLGVTTAGKCSFPQTQEKTGVEIVAVPT
ncbi:hypothetical protein B9Z19DRAFT_1096458 [Tuber borchii]|uniref:Extracellular membrane protein CFEM domain-containing protein n=1 Tax=Tuber borchii TaxID=42251 RepID=A0A2T6ZBH0_TUBBO|nr:hypothetical protein B9Z19DRAFT_1096458 [Tuber borchii]